MDWPELLTTGEMAAAEAFAMAAGTPGIELMERAGAGVADAAAGLVRGRDPIVVLCGPGNNGGDGFVAARLLMERGIEVRLGLLGDPAALRGDAAEAARRWGGAIPPAASLDLTAAGLVIDALFGSGLSRDIEGGARALVEALNDWRRRTCRPVVAADVPSGLDAGTGAVRGTAVEADATVCFFRARPGHRLMPGRALCGDLIVHDIGISKASLANLKPKTFANIPALWRADFPRPAIDGHKYSRGHALVLSGGPWSTGAARLAARGALRAGAGLVTLASPLAALAVNAGHLTAIMLVACDGPGGLAGILRDQRFNSVMLGPGLGVGEAARALVLAALESESEGRALTLDADALTSFAGRASELAVAIFASKMRVVLTPHDGEFSRLFNAQGGFIESNPLALDSNSQDPRPMVPADKLARARKAAAQTGATLVLKGPDTVVAHPDGRASISANAPPWLATAGSGDVLAGMIAGLLAQAMPAFEAVGAAVWLHGEAARRFGPGLISEDLPEALPGVLAGLAAQ